MSVEDLDRAVASVHRGPLEGFVTRRDALAKDLRAAGRTGDAATVKALRKPSRQAWALNAAAIDSPSAIERLAIAVAEVLRAQSGGDDLRAKLDELREAVRNFAAAAAQSAANAGHTGDQVSLSQAVSAVIGDTESFEALRAGRLVVIPATSELNLLASTRVTAAPSGTAEEPTTAAKTTSTAAVAARSQARGAEAAASVARDRTAAAERSLRQAEINATAAAEQLRLAQQRVEAAQRDLDRARQEVDAAQARQRVADGDVAAARSATKARNGT